MNVPGKLILGCKNTNGIKTYYEMQKNIRQPTFRNGYITIIPRRPYTKKYPYMDTQHEF